MSEVRKTAPCGVQTREQLQSMILLRAVWAEVLRLRGPAPLLDFSTTEPTEVLGRVLRAGTSVYVATRYMQWHASEMAHICGSDPEVFRPERWLRDGEFQTCQGLDSISFGQGARFCPGKLLADMEGMLLIAEVVRHFHLEAVEVSIGEVTSFTQTPDRDIVLGVHSCDAVALPVLLAGKSLPAESEQVG